MPRTDELVVSVLVIVDWKGEEPRGMLVRIAYRRRRAHEQGMGSMKAGHTKETSKDVGNVRAKDTLVGV